MNELERLRKKLHIKKQHIKDLYKCLDLCHDALKYYESTPPVFLQNDPTDPNQYTRVHIQEIASLALRVTQCNPNDFSTKKRSSTQPSH